MSFIRGSHSREGKTIANLCPAFGDKFDFLLVPQMVIFDFCLSFLSFFTQLDINSVPRLPTEVCYCPLLSFLYGKKGLSLTKEIALFLCGLGCVKT